MAIFKRPGQGMNRQSEPEMDQKVHSGMRMNPKTQRGLRILLEVCYLAIAGAYLGYRSFLNTMLHRVVGINNSNRVMNVFILLFTLLIVLKALFLRCYTKRDILFGAVFALVCVGSYYHCWTKWLEVVPFIVIAAKDVSFDRIVRVFAVVVGVVIFAGYISSMMGYSEYLVYPGNPIEGMTGRHAFGTTYPTTFSEFIFFLAAGILYLRRKKVNIIDIELLLLTAFFLRRYVYAKTGMICVLFLIILAFLLYLMRLFPGKLQKILHKLSAPTILLYPVLAAISIGLTLMYSPDSALLSRLDRMSTSRLSVGKKGYDMYGLSLLGRKVKYYTTGASTTRDPGDKYLNFDCSYMLVLINFGILTLVMLMGFLVLTSLRARWMNDLALLGILSIIAVECVMENRLMQPQYNVFLLAFFAKLETDTGQKYDVINGPAAE